ncbi:MAG: hypothetical protein AAB336_01480 [Acidobacteriota bacterium]
MKINSILFCLIAALIVLSGCGYFQSNSRNSQVTATTPLSENSPAKPDDIVQ